MSFGFGNSLPARRVNSLAAAGGGGGPLTSFDISGASYSGKSLDVKTLMGAISPNGVEIGQTGKFIVPGQNNQVYEFTLGTANDVSTGTLTDSGLFSGTTAGNFARGCSFANNGNSLYWFSETTDNVRKYNTAAPYQVSGLSFVAQGTAFNTDARDVWVSNDETKIIVSDRGGNTIDRRDMSTPGNITTIGFVQDVAVTTPDGVFLSEDGLVAIGLDDTTKDVVQWEMSVPFDLSTLTETFRFSVLTEVAIGTITGVAIDLTERLMLVSDTTSGLVFQYNL